MASNVRQTQEPRAWVIPGRGAGGLLDGEMLSREWGSGDRPVRADSLVDVERSYVLLAPGGAGKATLVEDLKRREQHSESVDLRVHSRESLASVIRSCPRTRVPCSSTLLPRPSNLIRISATCWSSFLARRTRGGTWRLACRPGSWTVDLATALRTTLPDFEELAWLPLDLRGVEGIAGPGAEVFLEQQPVGGSHS